MWDLADYGGFILSADSTFSNNNGTAIGNYNGLIKLVSNTVSGNGAASSGDGIWNGGLDSHAILEQTTVAGSAGVGLYNAGYTEITGSIVTGSGGADCAGPLDVTGGADSLDGDGTCPGFGDLTGFDPVLADNGGPTQTHAIFEGSSAVDNAGLCGSVRDQRGEPRFNECDSGSYELQGPSQEGISGTASGLVTLTGTCSNRDTDDEVDIPLQSEGTYSCGGLTAQTGDAIGILLRGPAQQTSIGGRVEEMILHKVICRNLTTGAIAAAPRTATQWSCAAGGFHPAAGDRVLLEVKGTSQ